MPEKTPLVTIGIPTYQRPVLLARALECVARQTCSEMEVLVSDNATPGSEVEAVVDQFRARIPRLKFVKQPVNVGATANFFLVLDLVQTKYFMWLADDDEVSDNYVESLLGLLESDDQVVTAAGNWYYARPDGQGELMPARDYTGPTAFGRLAKYMWKADDAFFYGLHRTEVLRQATVRTYAWPNRSDVRNFAYVYLIDMVIRGKVRMHPDRSVRFINHDYTTKTWRKGESRFSRIVKGAIRRMNVHALYLEKIAEHRGIVVAAPLTFVSAVSLMREGALAVSQIVGGRVRGLVRRAGPPGSAI